ncbi:MAG: asparaginase [Holophagaceae bacterium]|nr:asparaginase [Holophagaceae bacterium]
MRPHILMIHTGGTLGMAPSEDSGYLAPGTFLDQILTQLPELAEIADLELEVLFNCDSSSIEPENILLISNFIRERSTKYHGVVVIHGTDTMAFTASVLGFTLSDLDIPIVITGSQRPLAYVRSDARSNLIDAVTLATKGIAEVGICFGDHWIRGVAANKNSVHRYGAFDSPNLPYLAELGMMIQIYPYAGNFERRVPKEIGNHLECNIAVYTPHPGMPWDIAPSWARGVLIQAYGAGNLPMGRSDLVRLFEDAQKRELPVVLTSQCASGATNLMAYELGKRAAAMGAIAGGLHTRWAALAKLGLCLGASFNLKTIREAFATQWAGEPV